MKNELNDNLVEKDVEENERARKLYRYVSEVVRRLDDKMKTCNSIDDILKSSLEIQRHKLRETCEKLMFTDPINYGKKSLDLLWRKVYYETISTAKKVLDKSENDISLLNFMLSGIGNFHHLIARIKYELKLSPPFLDFIYDFVDEENGEIDKSVTEELKQFGNSALFSCLLYLGDLNRYQVDIFQFCDSSISARYYHLAVQVDTTLGMPYNQLGNLYLEKNYNLDSVCYYIHCLSCIVPFDGAMDNLNKIFEKNSQFLNSYQITESLTQVEHMQQMIVNFLSLVDIWYFDKNDDNIPQKCNFLAQAMKTAINFNKPDFSDKVNNYQEFKQMVEDETLASSYMNFNQIHKIVLICLFTMAKMVDVNEGKAFPCKAFTLAIMSLMLQTLLKQLEAFGLSNPVIMQKQKSSYISKSQITDLNDDKKPSVQTEIQNNVNLSEPSKCNENIDNNVNGKTTNGDIKNKKNLTKRLRRRRVISSESSDLTDSDNENSKSEPESTDSDSNLTGSYDDSKSDTSFDENDDEFTSDKINGNASKENIPSEDTQAEINTNYNDDNDKEKGNYEETHKEEGLDNFRIQDFLQGNNFLPSLKLLQDWILSEKKLLMSCGDSGNVFFQSVVDLLNIFTHYFHPENTLQNEECHIIKYAKRLAKNLQHDYRSIPLPEDLYLRGTTICKFDKDAAEWQTLHKLRISMYEENVIRILNFIDFGMQIAKTVPQIKFNRTQKIFYLKKTSPKFNTKINSKKNKEWYNSKTQVETAESGLLKRLGRLWLASRVRELEKAGPKAPTLIVLDAAALYLHLRQVKQLTKSKSFLLLIPTVVLQELDELKSESSARDAIRWLELQLKNGSRFLKAQKPDQSKPLPHIKLPKKTPPKIYKFIKILEFCNNFVTDDQSTEESGPMKRKSLPSLILLLGNVLDSDTYQCNEISSIATAQSIGISVKYIGDFVSKWRQTFHKCNKKR